MVGGNDEPLALSQYDVVTARNWHGVPTCRGASASKNRIRRGQDSTRADHPAFATFCSGVMRSAVMRLRARRSTSKRKPWKMKLWPGSGIDRDS